MQKIITTTALLFSFCFCCRAQFLIHNGDTSRSLGISGYMQPQFQMASEKGAKSFSGGDFPNASDSRFMIRRGRVRFDYSRKYKDGGPSLEFVFQVDAT